MRRGPYRCEDNPVILRISRDEYEALTGTLLPPHAFLDMCTSLSTRLRVEEEEEAAKREAEMEDEFENVDPDLTGKIEDAIAKREAASQD